MNPRCRSYLSTHAFHRFGQLVALCLIALLASLASPLDARGGEAPRVRRVLILHSFGRDFAPFNAVSSVFRSELARQSAAPIEFLEASLETARFTESGSEIPFVEYLRALFAERPPALMVPFGAPAMNFLQRHRERLFPGVPILVSALDRRHLRDVSLGANATAVSVRLDPGIVENILNILPRTKSIAVVIGNSPLEKFWLTELRQELQPFANRVQFTWLNELSFEEMRKRLAALPSSSAILYAILLVDAAGVPHEQERALEILHSEANAPIFGVFDSQLGRGIVGGPLYPTQEVSRESVRLALRILGGESPGTMQPLSLGPGTPVYDWRELKRWAIPERSLPPDSIVQFRPASVWEEYKWWAVSAFIIIAIQTAIIADLLVERARRRRAQTALGESEQRLDLAASSADLGLWVWDIIRDEVWITAKGRELFGFEGSKPINLNRFLNALHAEDREAVGLAVTNSLNDGVYEGEYRVVLPNGQTRWFAGRGRVEFDRSSKPVRMRGVSLDITERKRAEEMLKEDQFFLRQVIDIAPNFIFAKDRDGRFTLVNQAVADAYGTTVENLIGKTDADFNPNTEEVEFFRRTDLEVMDTLRERFVSEEHITDAKGQIRWLQTVKRPIIDKSGVANHVLGSATDITARRRAEHAARRQREEMAHTDRVLMMGQLASAVAHELNQPLGAILSNAEAAEIFLQAEPPALDELRAILADIRKDDQRAANVIQRMRALLKRRALELQTLPVDELITGAIALTKPDAFLRRITVEAQLEVALPPVRGDAVHLEQVLLNLMLNGMDSLSDCPTEQRRLVVGARRADPHGVEVSVTDNGNGIPTDKLDQVFEPFYSTKPNGIGMGLAISRTIIEAHHGRIWAENNLHGGATFRFTVTVGG